MQVFPVLGGARRPEDASAHEPRFEALETRMLLSAAPDALAATYIGSGVPPLEARAAEPHLSGAADTAASAWAQGGKDILYVRVDFADMGGDPVSEAVVAAALDQTDDFVRENSYGQTWIESYTITETLRLPQTAAWYGEQEMEDGTGADLLRIDALQAAEDAGYVLDDYWSDIVAFDTIPEFAWAGLGYVADRGVWLNGYFDFGVTAHELGHNLGAWHSGFWDSPGATLGDGFQYEYGNPFDIMGDGLTPSGEFSAFWKSRFGWLAPGHVTEVSSSGTYRLYALDEGATTEAASYALVLEHSDGREYWLEFRQDYSNNLNVSNGVLVNLAPWVGSESTDISLLDMTPDSAGGLADTEDAALEIGEIYDDGTSGFFIKPMLKGGTDAKWIDVAIVFGDGVTPPSGDVVQVSGTSGDDLAVVVVHETHFIVRMNGVTTTYDRTEYGSVDVDLGGGDDRINVVLTSGDDAVEVEADGSGRATQAITGGDPYLVEFTSAETSAFYSNGGIDSISFVGTSADEVYRANSNSALMRGSGQLHWMGGMAVSEADGGGGRDAAFFVGSTGDEEYSASQALSMMSGNGRLSSATNFGWAYGYGNGGDDTAVFQGSVWADTFVAREVASLMRNRYFFAWAHDFDTIDANADATNRDGSRDVAYLYGTDGDEVLTAEWHDRGALSGDGFVRNYNGFERIHAFGFGGNDRAVLLEDPYSTETIETRLHDWSFMSGLRHSLSGHGFETIDAYLSGFRDRLRVAYDTNGAGSPGYEMNIDW